jgi:hypothetical protein
MKIPALLALFLAACGAPPTVLPPPFGEVGDQTPRLFFPTGMAVTGDGKLLVANGNFNHAFEGGTVVSLQPAWIDSVFASTLRCETVAVGSNPACDFQIPTSAFLGVAMIGNYAGPLVLDEAGTTAYTGSRDSNRLNGVSLLPDGKLYCRNRAAGDVDCRGGIVDLSRAATLEGPYSIVPGVARLPGSDADARVLFVSALIPHVDEILGGTMFTSATVAALDMADPSQVRFSMLASNQFAASGTGVGPMIFDSVRRRLLLSGCYQRVGSGSGGEPGSIKCSGVNTLRVLDVDAGPAAQVRIYDISVTPSSGTTSGLLLGPDDPARKIPATTLWATVRSPDALLEIDLPTQGSLRPTLRRLVSLPISPADLVRIPRPGAADLIAVASTRLGAVVIYDTGVQEVVAQIERLGDTPFTIKALPAPAGTARLAVSVFGDCRLAFIHVPLDKPWNAALRARAGTCR